MALEPLTAVLEIGGKLIDKLFPDPEKKAEALMALEKLRQEGDLKVIAGQIEVNKAEAANTNLFVSGWRPFVGWVCGSALAFQLVIAPMILWGATLAGHAPLSPPIMQTELLTTLLVGMLGLGGMRTVEKLQGVATK